MRLDVHRGDITKLDVDAIVNAANSSLLGGGGVDGAIHRAAGKDLEFACRMLGGCKTGEAKVTEGFDLPARYIIHTVGPVWNEGKGNPEALLASCYRESMKLAQTHGINSIAFPCISTGIYKFPRRPAANIAIQTVREFVDADNVPETVIFCCFSQTDAELYQELLA